MRFKKSKLIIKIIYLFFINIVFCSNDTLELPSIDKSPKLTLIVVIDQFSAHYINKLKPFLHGGIKFLVTNGINYLNAFYPHALPGTGPGHSMLSTGTCADYHGIVNNKWFNSKGQKIKCDDDLPGRAAVFAPDGKFYNYGKSSHNILVDGLSDQLKIYSYPHANNNVWSLSIKPRSAICTSGKLGKAIWFDEEGTQYTSSKAYFDKLPSWLNNFNKRLSNRMRDIQGLFWPSFFYDNSQAYNFYDINNYNASRISFSIINKIINITKIIDDHGTITDKKIFNKAYTRLPISSQHLCDLAKVCIDNNLSNNKSDRLILWLCVANLDKIGHIFGPSSKEAIDTIYHIDDQLGDLFEYIFNKVDPRETLFVLTADHGIKPISQLVRNMGLDISRTYFAPALINDMNNLIAKKYGIEKIIQNFNKPQFYLDQSKLKFVAPNLKNNILLDLKNYLKNLPGISKTWTFDELENQIFENDDPNKYFKKQLFKGRSGQIIYAVSPYTLVDENLKGTSHSSKFAYDTNVPLIIYQQGRFEKKVILNNVYMYQLPVTLANILGVPRPSAAYGSVLPL